MKKRRRRQYVYTVENLDLNNDIDFYFPSDPPAEFGYSAVHRGIIQSPERALMVAVLEDGIRTAMGQIAGIDRSLKALEIRIAREWLLRDRETYLYDFRSICSVLGIEPSGIRRLVKRRIKMIERCS